VYTLSLLNYHPAAASGRFAEERVCGLLLVKERIASNLSASGTIKTFEMYARKIGYERVKSEAEI